MAMLRLLTQHGIGIEGIQAAAVLTVMTFLMLSISSVGMRQKAGSCPGYDLTIPERSTLLIMKVTAVIIAAHMQAKGGCYQELMMLKETPSDMTNKFRDVVVS